MKLMYVLNGTAHEEIQEYDPVFPGVPLSQRYPAEFLANVVEVDDAVEVGYRKTETGFEPPPEPEAVVVIGDTVTTPDTLTQLQLALAELAELIAGGEA